MSCNCNQPIQDFYTLQQAPPRNPLERIIYAEIDTAGVGDFQRRPEFVAPSGAYTTSPFTMGADATCEAWEVTNAQRVADAEMWNMGHLATNNGGTIPPALQKLAFLRAGHPWKMNVNLDLADDIDLLLISFLDNAGTRGDAQGMVPVLAWETLIGSGSRVLTLTITPGPDFTLGLWARETPSANISMFDIDVHPVM